MLFPSTKIITPFIYHVSLKKFHLPKRIVWAMLKKEKRRKEVKLSMPWWGFIHIWAIERIIWGTYICFTKLIKPLDRWLIEEWMIGDSVITVISCNHPRTWKSYMPHRDQGKGWIKMPTYMNCGRIFCYRHGTCELYWHSRNSWSTTTYLAICLGRAKVKLGGFVGGS